MNNDQDRGSLEGPPASMAPKAAPSETMAPPGGTSGTQSDAGTPAATSSFDLNQPTIISLLYLSSFLLGVTVIVGVVLAFVWKAAPRAEWEASHYEYLINTFWIGLLGGIASVILMVVVIGFLLLPAVMVLVVVRCVLSLINAQKQAPMPNPGTWLA